MKEKRRYPTDLTDKQWEKLEPLLPARSPTNRGRPPKYTYREIVNGMLYVLRGGISWRMLPSDLPPWRSVYWYFMQWRDKGVFEQLNDTLRAEYRVSIERNPEPSAVSIDTQSVKTTEKGGLLDTEGSTQASV
ncbi:MAG: putative transposase [Chloroflexia bacterium]|jgi:putative transposase|nr:putative transposase [Chloroflexia bacterium]